MPHFFIVDWEKVLIGLSLFCCLAERKRLTKVFFVVPNHHQRSSSSRWVKKKDELCFCVSCFAFGRRRRKRGGREEQKSLVASLKMRACTRYVSEKKADTQHIENFDVAHRPNILGHNA